MAHSSKIFTLWSCIRNSLLTIGIGLFAFQFYFIIYLAELGLCGCTYVFSSYGERGLFFVEVHELLIVVASLVEHRL